MRIGILTAGLREAAASLPAAPISAGREEIVSRPMRNRDIHDLTAFRAQIRCAALELLGSSPFVHSLPINSQVINEQDAGRYVRKKVRYGNESDDVVWAWLLLPKARRGPTAAIICLPETSMTPNQGKDGPAGLGQPLHPGDPEAYGHDLANLGYICLCPDLPCAGERTAKGCRSYDTTLLDKRFPTWTRMGISVWDVGRAIDFLSSVAGVNPLQIGCVGFSQGGDTALWAAAMHPRIAAVASVCGWTTFRGANAEPLLASYNYPRLRPYVGTGKPLPMDRDDLAALIAPRPFLNISAEYDEFVVNKSELYAAETEIALLYERLAAGDRFRAVHLSSDHAYSRAAADEVFRWFNNHLPLN